MLNWSNSRNCRSSSFLQSKDKNSTCSAAIAGCVAGQGKLLETRLQKTETSGEKSYLINCLVGHQSCSLTTKLVLKVEWSSAQKDEAWWIGMITRKSFRVIHFTETQHTHSRLWLQISAQTITHGADEAVKSCQVASAEGLRQEPTGRSLLA